MNPLFLWWLSCQVYKRDLYFLARFLKTVNFLVFHAILPYQADIERDIELSHYGLGVVIHANVKIGHRVRIYQHVTLATETWIGSEYKIFVEDDVVIGAGAVVVGRGNKSLTIGAGAKIGANAVVPKIS
jgi:serine O-acetyltransferase